MATAIRASPAPCVWEGGRPEDVGVGDTGRTLPKQATNFRRGWVHGPATKPCPTTRCTPAVAGNGVQHTVGTGVQRIYPEVRREPREFGHPPRPILGSIADLDRILEHCDYDTGKYIRDCHEYLRLGAGLDNAARLRREHVEDLRYIYVPDAGTQSVSRSQIIPHANSNFTIKDSNDWQLTLSTPNHHVRDISSPCHEDDPRIFHMFWAGEFTDKPYMAILAFLFTQNHGLHLDSAPLESDNCRPQLWLWLSHVSTDATSNPAAQDDLIAELRQNPWASPFLHPRFRGLVQFRLWNTTEQLDSIPELKDDWRALGHDLLRSEGKSPPKGKGETTGIPISLDGTAKVTHQSYNKVPVVLSDLARFVLCHRFGGVYLDVDMLFLRDWEELWGWSGSFSYRWSHEHRYNTAVLRLRRGSALGTFLIRTALVNGLDFHPTTVTRYLKDAHMTELLYRIPDALFDPGWQTCDYIKGWFGTTYLQRDRPPQPYFTDFDQFFNTPDVMSGMPSVIGFDGFFRGAFLYHYHNEWWKPFDRARYWPDLGPRFAEAERMGRAAIANQSAAFVSGLLPRDKRDLDWATVMKRTFEAYMRGERPNMYGEWIRW
ncbi:hypothetical protein C8Q74DRAFT_458665 [Fomes fomentarius]|nr:hypothetical protein C8Q74DRAFT_458665 [Fomes fomentarius]